MTSMWNTEDTQRPACTLVSTPVRSLDSGVCLSAVIYAWHTWVNYSAKTHKKVISIFQTVLVQKSSNYARYFVTLARSKGVKSFQENSKKSCHRKILAPSHLPSNMPQNCAPWRTLDHHLHLQIFRFSKKLSNKLIISASALILEEFMGVNLDPLI